MQYEAAEELAPAVVYRNVVVGWINDPLWILRPADRPLEDTRPVLGKDANPVAFTVGTQDMVVANAKLRPVLVVSGRFEIAAGGGLRAVPIHRRAGQKFHEPEWDLFVGG